MGGIGTLAIGAPSVRLVSGGIALGLTLVGLSACGSGEDPSAATGVTASEYTTNAQVTCERYYAFDLYRHTQVQPALAGTDVQQSEALGDYADLASVLAAAALSAVTIGQLPDTVQLASEKVLNPLERLVAAQGSIADVSGPIDTKIERQSAIIEGACLAAGQPIPEANLAARASTQDE